MSPAAARQMHAAVLHEHGAAPRYGPFEEAAPQDGSVVIEVAAASLHHLDLLKASGSFYPASGDSRTFL